jgi:hypothetical protein
MSQTAWFRRLEDDPLEAAKIIVTALGEPPGVPPGCLTLLLFCYHSVIAVWSRGAEGMTRQIVSQYHDFFLATIRFLTVPRSPEQLRAVDQALRPKICRCADGPEIVRSAPGSLKGHCKRGSKDTLLFLLSGMCGAITEAINAQKGLIIENWPRRRVHGRWPASLDEMLPGGPNSLTSLANWLYLPAPARDLEEREQVAMLFFHLFNAAPPYSLVALCKSTVLLDWTCDIIIQNVDAMEHKRGRTIGRELAAAAMIIETVYGFLSDEETVLWASSSSRYPVDQVCGMLYRMVTTFCTLPPGISATEKQRFDIIKEAAGSVAQRLVPLPRVATAGIMSAQLRQILLTDKARRDANLANVLQLLAFAATCSQRCCGPSCTTPFGVELQICGRCRVARYCSRACQKGAWVYPGGAHREVCWVYKAWHVAGKEPNEAFNKTLDSMPPGRLQAVCDNIKTLRASQFARLSKLLCSY